MQLMFRLPKRITQLRRYSYRQRYPIKANFSTLRDALALLLVLVEDMGTVFGRPLQRA